MLYYTNGTINEDRFQKMTDAQWVFQNAVINKQRAKETIERHKFDSLQARRLEIVIRDMIPLIINNDLPQDYLQDSMNHYSTNSDKRIEMYNEILTDGVSSEDKEAGEDKKSKNVNDLDIHNADEVEEYFEKIYNSVPDEIVVPGKILQNTKLLRNTFGKNDLQSETRFQKETPDGEGDATPKLVFNKKGSNKSKQNRGLGIS